MDYLSLARQQYDWMVDVRRALHKIPEEGLKEYKTRALIKEKLTEIGVPFEESEKGWITAFVKGGEGTVTAIRGDIDALPVTEPEGLPFRSTHEGWMHACGHDMHTAVMLGTARLLKNLPSFEGGALFMFEPAEETIGGAKMMAESGMMEKAGASRVYGMHVMPRLTVGQIETRPLTLNAGTDGLTFTVHGVSSHGAYPENGVDAIVCAAQLITALQSVVARTVSPLENAVITIGKIEGGKADNILCDKVTMKGTLRTADEALRTRIVNRITDICEGTGKAMGCKIDCEIKRGYSALVNDPAHAKRVLDLASQIVGPGNTLIKDAPSMGAEDFSSFLDRVPGAFFHVGCASDKNHPCAPLHSEKFLPDEQAMLYGCAMEAALINEK